MPGPTGKMRKLDRKAKDNGVLGVTGNSYVQAQEKHKERTKPKETVNAPRLMLTEMERRAL